MRNKFDCSGIQHVLNMEYKNELQDHLLKIEDLFSQIANENERFARTKEHFDKVILDKQSKIDKTTKENNDLLSNLKETNKVNLENKEKIKKLENIIRLNQRKFLEKSAKLQKIINTYQKYCSCGVANKIQIKLSGSKYNEIESEEKVQKVQSFMSNEVKELAPMTEQFCPDLSNISQNNVPVIGETEYPFHSPNDVIECSSDDDDDDSSKSPSLLRHNPLTPEILTTSLSPIIKKSTPVINQNQFETSAELFNDSPRTSAKETIAVKGNTHTSKKMSSAHIWIDKKIAKPKDEPKKDINLKQKQKKLKKKYDINNDSFFNSPLKPINNTNPITSNHGLIFNSPVKPVVRKDSSMLSTPNMPLSSVQDTTKNVLLTNDNNINESLEGLDDTAFFNKLLKKEERQPEIRATKVIRGKANREKLDGFACHECRSYYASDNLTDDQLKEVLKHCSKHRHDAPPPPDTPDGFWTIGFPETQEYMEKGYLVQDENNHNTKLNKGKKRRLKYQ